MHNRHAALRVGEYVEVQTNNPAVFAMLRASKEEAALIIVNLSKDAVADYALSAKASSVKPGEYRVAPMLHLEGEDEGALSNLIIDAQGGFSNYVPGPTLSPQSYLVVQLQK